MCALKTFSDQGTIHHPKMFMNDFPKKIVLNQILQGQSQSDLKHRTVY